MKDTLISFCSNLLAVILGIVITFAIQGKIDRTADRKDVRAALELVRSELTTNLEDIGIMQDYLRQERKSAEYFLEHRSALDRCPEDSVIFHGSMIFADASITLSHDALELLKNSSIFQKVGDSGLSMKIIRAYDTCESAVTNLNRHVSTRNAQFDASVTDKTASQFASNGSIDMRKYIKTPYGLYTIRWITAQPDPEELVDEEDILAAVEAIDAYGSHGLRGRKKR